MCTAFAMAVSTGPGATALTRMPSDGKFGRLLLGQVREAGFAGAVGGAQRRGAQARDRGDVDDGAAAGVAHQRRRGLRAQERAGEIDRQHARPVLVGDVEDRLEDGDAGIVDQRVEPAEFLRDGVEGAGHALRVGDVAGRCARVTSGLAERRERALQVLAVDVEQRHAPALGEKALGGGEPDAARGAGDQGGFRCGLAHAAIPRRMPYGSMAARPKASGGATQIVCEHDARRIGHADRGRDRRACGRRRTCAGSRSAPPKRRWTGARAACKAMSSFFIRRWPSRRARRKRQARCRKPRGRRAKGRARRAQERRWRSFSMNWRN